MLPNPGTLRKIMPLDSDGTAILYLWTDVCNVYVLHDGAHALLIDLGDGSVLDHLGGIGVDLCWPLGSTGPPPRWMRLLVPNPSKR